MTWPDRNAILDWLPKAGQCAELGVYKGVFSNQILVRNQPQRLVLVDPWEPYPGIRRTLEDWDDAFQHVQSRFAEQIEAGQVVVERDSAINLAPRVSDNEFDWIMHDAEHGYLEVVRDLVLWWPKIKVGGYLLCHDFRFPAPGSSKNTGVIPAIYEVASCFKMEYVGVTDDAPPMTIVMRK